MPLAVRLPRHFVVIHVEPDTAVRAAEAMRMELLPAVCLQVLPLNALVALPAQRAIKLVVMLRTARRIAVDVELCTRKRSLACLAGEALLVIAACETAISGFDGLAVDVRATATAFAFGDGLLEAGWLGGVDVWLGALPHARRRIAE